MVTDVIKCSEDHQHQMSKCQIKIYQNKDGLSVCRILLLQRKPKLGCMRPADRKLDIVIFINLGKLTSSSQPCLHR